MGTARGKDSFAGLPARWRSVLRWLLLGAVSGTLATVSIFAAQWLDADFLETSIDLGNWSVLLASMKLSISPLTISPGLLFGAIAGFALRQRGLATGWRYPAYIAAATVAYFVTVQLTVNVLIDAVDDLFAVGALAGLFGAGALAAATAALIPAMRQWAPCLLMTAAGAILGTLLVIPIASGLPEFFAWLLLFGPWQAGFAAAMATAFDDR